MKTGKLLLLAPAILSMGAMPHHSRGAAAIADVDPAAALSSLVSEFAGNYTKKTTIALKSDAVTELDKYFHTKVTETYRTTYYSDSNEALLMAPQDGTLGGQQWGGFRVVDGKCQRFHVEAGTEVAVAALTGGTVDYNYGSGSKLYDFYKNMEYFAQSNYFSGWGEYTAGSSYYYNFSAEEQAAKEGGAYTNKFIADFLAFAAPQLLPNFGAYFTPKSVTVVKDYDAKGVEYLAFRMYVVEGDKGKLDTNKNQYFGADGLCEARIYKNLSKFSEDLGTGYYLVGSFNSWSIDQNYRLVADPEDANQMKITKQLSYKAEAKVLSSKGVYSEFESFNYGKTSDDTLTGNYVVVFPGTYTFYYKLNTTKVYPSFDSKSSTEVYLNPNSDWKKDGARFAVYCFKDGGSNEWINLTADGSYYKASIDLTKYEKIIFCRMNPSGPNNWDNEWNQTDDIDVTSLYRNVYSITGWDKSGNWSNTLK